MKVDIFAAAIILFIMVSEHPPFTAARPDDPYYKCIAAERADVFWRTHLKDKPSPNFYSDEFKNLIESMLHLDASSRPSIDEIMAHAWM
jgi:serine/threonine protein kinase